MIRVDQMLCAGCGACVDACSNGAISLSQGKALVDPALCDGCRSFGPAQDRPLDEAIVVSPSTGHRGELVEPSGQALSNHQDRPFDGAQDRSCVATCPNAALTWVVPEGSPASSVLVVVAPPIEVIPVETRAPLPWRRAVLPALGGALSWVGREVVPRLAPLALDALDSALDRRLSRWSRDEGVTPAPTGSRRSRRKGQRRRHRHGRPSE